MFTNNAKTSQIVSLFLFLLFTSISTFSCPPYTETNLQCSFSQSNQSELLKIKSDLPTPLPIYCYGYHCVQGKTTTNQNCSLWPIIILKIWLFLFLFTICVLAACFPATMSFFLFPRHAKPTLSTGPLNMSTLESSLQGS